MRIRLCLLSVLWLTLGAGCSSRTDPPADGDADGDVDGDADADADGEPDADDDGDADVDETPHYPIDEITVEWTPCSLYEGENDGRAECSTTAMPLRWAAPDGRTIEIAAKRLRAAGGAEAQLWLIPGGPGASGTFTHPPSMELFQSRYPGLDVYTIDHRGTGRSGNLTCPDQEAETSPGGTSIIDSEWEACFATLDEQWGDGLAEITASNSAIDLAALIEATRTPEQRVFLYGGSYGSYLAQRYLTIFPEQADGVVLAGIMPADGTIISSDEDANQVGQDLLALCAADETCSSYLSDDPWAFYGEALERLAAGDCRNVTIGADTFKLLLFYALYYFPMNSTVPALIYRLHRCEPEDDAAIRFSLDLLFGTTGFWTTLEYSIILQFHVMLSEMWESADYADVDLFEYFAELSRTTRVGRNQGLSRMLLRERWPLYHDERYDDAWAETTTPLLMLQGRLDPATAYAQAVRTGEHFSGPHQHFVVFDQASHSVLSGTPLSADPADSHCAMQLMLDFLNDPTAELDTSCVADVLPIDFAGTPELARAYLGTDDFYE